MSTSNKELLEAYYNRVFDLLILHGGAHESMRSDFIFNHTSESPCNEYRFQGSLGFGGKYYREKSRVSCYSEDENTKRIVAIRVLNDALQELKSSL